MSQTVRDLIEEIRAELAAARLEPPAEVLRVMKHGLIDSGAGTGGQCFSTWVFVAGDIRYLAFYAGSNIVALAQRPDFTEEHIRAMAKKYFRLSAEFLGYCGFRRLWEITQRVIEGFGQVESKAQLVELIDAFALLCSMYNQWVQHYFPWGLGSAFPHVTPERLAEAQALAQTGRP